MLAVVVHVVGALLTILYATDAATDAGFSFVVLSQILRIRQYGLQELQRHDLDLNRLLGIVCQGSLILYLVDTAHADVLDHVEMFQILFAKSHPETPLLDGGEILHQRLQLLMMQQVRLTRTNVRIGQWFVNLQRLCLNPLPVFVVETFLRNLPDVDLRIEISSEGMVMVSGIAVHDIEIVHLVEVMLGSIGCINATHTGVKSTA